MGTRSFAVAAGSVRSVWSGSASRPAISSRWPWTTARPPGPAHQDEARAAMVRFLKDDGTGRFRFGAPVRERLPKYLFEPRQDGQAATLGWVPGWRVDVWAAAKNVYGPGEQPYMVFFRDGQLRGIFVENRSRNAPLGLDQWGALFVAPAGR